METRTKILIGIGISIVAAFGIGYLIYTQVKKSKNESPESEQDTSLKPPTAAEIANVKAAISGRG